jgi:transcriptional antiterminator NusG
MMAVRGSKQLSEIDRVWLDHKGEPINIDRAWVESDRQVGLSRRAQALLAGAGESGPVRCWFVVCVAHSHENAVDEALGKLGVETWLPVDINRPTRRGGRSKGRREMVPNPAVPGYLMVRISPFAHVLVGIKACENVLEIVGGWENPKPVSDSDINGFREFLKLSERERRKLAALELKKRRPVCEHDSVVVVDGPFAGRDGVVVREKDEATMWVSLMLFGGVVPVAVPLAQLRKSD